jgi:hypothetical protein
LCRWGHLHTVRVCKGPPLHHLPMILLISLRQGMFTFLESLYEACADGDICTPLFLHTVRVCKGPPLHHLPMILFIFIISGMLTFLESLYEACADGDICTPLFLHTDTGMQRSPFALCGTSFCFITQLR